MNVRYVTDAKGRLKAAVVPLGRYQRLLSGKLDAAAVSVLRDQLRVARVAIKPEAHRERGRH